MEVQWLRGRWKRNRYQLAVNADPLRDHQVLHRWMFTALAGVIMVLEAIFTTVLSFWGDIPPDLWVANGSGTW
jgi:succinate dehydrogenase hydrophobic anchor subunit